MGFSPTHHNSLAMTFPDMVGEDVLEGHGLAWGKKGGTAPFPQHCTLSAAQPSSLASLLLLLLPEINHPGCLRSPKDALAGQLRAPVICWVIRGGVRSTLR